MRSGCIGLVVVLWSAVAVAQEEQGNDEAQAPVPDAQAAYEACLKQHEGDPRIKEMCPDPLARDADAANVDNDDGMPRAGEVQGAEALDEEALTQEAAPCPCGDECSCGKGKCQGECPRRASGDCDGMSCPRKGKGHCAACDKGSRGDCPHMKQGPCGRCAPCEKDVCPCEAKQRCPKRSCSKGSCPMRKGHQGCPYGGSKCSRGGGKLSVSGFIHGDLNMYMPDGGGEDELSFRPRETEVNLVYRRGAGELRIDANILVDGNYVPFGGAGLSEQMANRIFEQAYASWQPGDWNITFGAFNSPVGAEPLDAINRLALGRAWVSQIATPDRLMGARVAYQLGHVGTYVLVSNGWDRLADNNDSKSIGAGVSYEHDFGTLHYEGALHGLVGAERADNEDVRGVFDYAGLLTYDESWLVRLDIVYGFEEGLGHRQRTGALDPQKVGYWYGGMLSFETLPGIWGSECWRALRLGARLEYLHDHDLIIGLPHIPDMTTLLGLTATARYEVTPGIEVGLEYRNDAQRADVENFRVRRNFPFWENVFNPDEWWFMTQEVTLGVVGRF